MKLLPRACLVAGLFLAVSSSALAENYDSSPPDEGSYNRIDKTCRFFDKVVFKIKDGQYAGRLFDIKIVERSIKDITDLNKEVKQACERNSYSRSYGSKGSYHLPCSEVKNDNYEIFSVDFAVACANNRY